MASPERRHIERPAQWDEHDLPKMFDGAAKRRRVAWVFALIAVFAVAAMVIATVASHFRPT